MAIKPGVFKQSIHVLLGTSLVGLVQRIDNTPTGITEFFDCRDDRRAGDLLATLYRFFGKIPLPLNVSENLDMWELGGIVRKIGQIAAQGAARPCPPLFSEIEWCRYHTTKIV